MATQLGNFEKFLRVGEGRRLKRLKQQAEYIGTLEADFENADLKAKTAEFKQRLENGEAREDMLFEAYAAVREAFKRTMDVRLFDVQLMGGIALHEGDIAEMKTGEGKTFVAVQPLYLNSLTGENVHLVTVNDYLAKRDAEWTKPVWDALGMRVGFIQNLMPFAERQAAYDGDVTYGTNSEFGFDYLRDNMAVALEGVVQRSHTYAIVDEVDSILIDEARTPLIISGEPETAAQTYYDFARVVKTLEGRQSEGVTPKGVDETEQSGLDYTYDEKHKTVSPSQVAIDKVERALGIDNLYDPRNVQLVNHLNQALKAQALYKRDVDYVIQDSEVKIVDEFTGRIMEGRRWSEGLHQAIEAKEGVRIKEENQTLATITIQNYFKMYDKLAGMTGTAKTQLTEFEETYELGVTEIPTNRPMIREDRQDLIFKTEEAKWDSVVEDIIERNESGQPILVGTVSIEKSEHLSNLLNRRGVKHSVLNAKNHEKEATIVAQAGRKGSVTVATNMAGRGVDILLGGNPEYLARQEMAARDFDNDRYLLFEMDEEERASYEAEYEPILGKFKAQTDAEHDEVVDVGGLYVLGTERHESRRIDNQLRGRSGRQGDPGESEFYLSFQDDLMRMFASDRVASIMERLKWPEDEPIEAKMVTRAVQNAQGQIEELNYERRKNVLKYDEVMNGQRTVIYGERRKILEGGNLKDESLGFVREVIEATVATYCPPDVFDEEWDRAGLRTALAEVYPMSLTEAQLAEIRTTEELQAAFVDDALGAYAAKEEAVGPEVMRELERVVLLNILDTRWREHLYEMDYLQEGIYLRSYAQKDPITEYRREAFDMFEELTSTIRSEFARYIYRVELVRPEEQQRRVAAPKVNRVREGRGDGEAETAGAEQADNPNQVISDKVPRNAPCPCGSGRKYKKCHGAVA